MQFGGRIAGQLYQVACLCGNKVLFKSRNGLDLHVANCASVNRNRALNSPRCHRLRCFVGRGVQRCRQRASEMATVRDDDDHDCGRERKGAGYKREAVRKTDWGGSGLVNQFRFCFFCFFGLERPLGTLTLVKKRRHLHCFAVILVGARKRRQFTRLRLLCMPSSLRKCDSCGGGGACKQISSSLCNPPPPIANTAPIFCRVIVIIAAVTNCTAKVWLSLRAHLEKRAKWMCPLP